MGRMLAFHKVDLGSVPGTTFGPPRTARNGP